MSTLDVLEVLDEDRYGEFVGVGCKVCEEVERVLFDRRSGRPWSSPEECECGAPASMRDAIEDGWEYR